jgi:hypothetical protein
MNQRVFPDIRSSVIDIPSSPIEDNDAPLDI